MNIDRRYMWAIFYGCRTQNRLTQFIVCYFFSTLRRHLPRRSYFLCIYNTISLCNPFGNWVGYTCWDFLFTQVKYSLSGYTKEFPDASVLWNFISCRKTKHWSQYRIGLTYMNNIFNSISTVKKFICSKLVMILK